jgi:hypothetical protein
VVGVARERRRQVAGYPVVVFGGKHADVPITAEMGGALGRLIASDAPACVIDLSELGSNAARRRFMAAFSEALYEANEEPLHLVLDEADLWAPQRPIKGWEGLLGHIEEIVRRGRVRGFIPWLFTQRPAVVHKDVLSQADILIAMKLMASQDRDAIGGWIEGPTGRKASASSAICRGYSVAKGIFGRRAAASSIASPFRRSAPSTARARQNAAKAWRRHARSPKSTLRRSPPPLPLPRRPRPGKGIAAVMISSSGLAAAKARIEVLERENRDLVSRLAEIAALAGSKNATAVSMPELSLTLEAEPPRPVRAVSADAAASSDCLHPAARKLLMALAQHAPARFTWSQLATLAGLKPSGGHFNAGREHLRERFGHDYGGGTRRGRRGAGSAVDPGRAARPVVRPVAIAGSRDTHARCRGRALHRCRQIGGGARQETERWALEFGDRCLAQQWADRDRAGE